ncbi:hypothetical protein [Haladaptatus sp. DYF46]|uniref:hypothetical protein n=1 Tax=Haladaptatus sp. DYF46 TaxID=2886041 RepID=UPI001E2F4285|nr:hypothetical protein [Haladaptatus sp. DYF46]
MTGTVTISVELELGWGMHDKGEFSHLSNDRSAEDTALSRLLDVCDSKDVPITFDVVGHLFHETCDGTHDGPYDELWWSNDPGKSVSEDPLFYAPDMLESIRSRRTPHEICTHTYSHILGREASDELLHHELDAVDSLHEEWDLPASTSIVMPRHQDVDYSVLSDHGIDVIRRPIADYGRTDSNPASKFWWLLTRDHPECTLEVTEGVVETTCTPHPSLASTTLPTGRRPPAPFFRPLPNRLREYLHRKYLLDALRTAADGNHVHLWTHLYNIANPHQFRAIEPVFGRLAELRNRGEVEIRRMCDLPEVVA